MHSLARLPFLVAAALAAAPLAAAQSPSLVWFEDVSLPTPLPGSSWLTRLDVLPRADGGAWIQYFGEGQEALYSFTREGDFLGEVQLGGATGQGTVHEVDGSNGLYRMRTTSSGSPYGPSNGFRDVIVERFDESGQLLWGQRIGGSDNDDGGALVSTSDGGVYVTGVTGGGGDLGGQGVSGRSAVFAAKLSAGGAIEWVSRAEVLYSSFQSLRIDSAAADSADRLFVAYETGDPACYIRCEGFDACRFAPDGQLDWIDTVIPGADVYDRSAAVGSILPDGAGGLWAMAHTSFTFGGTYNTLRRLDATGATASSVQLGDLGWGLGQLMDMPGGGMMATKRLFVGGSGATNARLGFVTGLDGSTPVESQLLGDDGTGSYPQGSALGADGSIWAVGYRQVQSSAIAGAWIARHELETVGLETSCVPNANSTGETGSLSLIGDASVQARDLHLSARELPPGVPAIFIAASAAGNATLPASNGVLCVSGAIGRFAGPGQLRVSDRFGFVDLAIDPLELPRGVGLVPANAGETWYFQAWFRDAAPTPTSNTTNAIALTFQ